MSMHMRINKCVSQKIRILKGREQFVVQCLGAPRGGLYRGLGSEFDEKSDLVCKA